MTIDIINEKRLAIINEARKWIGTPYHHQASVIKVGCDCLGLVRGVWRGIYGSEPEIPPPYTADWAESSGQETLAIAAARYLEPRPLDMAMPGDVLLFSYSLNSIAKHCAILSTPCFEGHKRIIHAYNLHAVAEVSLIPWWQSRLRYVFSFPER